MRRVVQEEKIRIELFKVVPRQQKPVEGSTSEGDHRNPTDKRADNAVTANLVGGSAQNVEV